MLLGEANYTHIHQQYPAPSSSNTALSSKPQRNRLPATRTLALRERLAEAPVHNSCSRVHSLCAQFSQICLRACKARRLLAAYATGPAVIERLATEVMTRRQRGGDVAQQHVLAGFQASR